MPWSPQTEGDRAQAGVLPGDHRHHRERGVAIHDIPRHGALASDLGDPVLIGIFRADDLAVGAAEELTPELARERAPSRAHRRLVSARSVFRNGAGRRVGMICLPSI
jgi:hypothetical protein